MPDAMADEPLAVVCQQVVDADDARHGRQAPARAVRTAPIVMLDVGGQGLGPARLAVPRTPVLPLLGERPVHALDLAVLPGAEGARVEVADALRPQQRVELARAVAGAVVGHHALDGDAQAREEGQAAGHEGGAGGPPLVGQELGVRHAGEVVDGDVEARGARPAPRPAPAPEGAVAAPVGDARHLLHVHVHELARALALVADRGDGPAAPDLPGDAVDVGEPRQPRARHDPGAGAGGHARGGGEGERGEQHGAPRLDDPRLGLGRRGPREPARPARSVGHGLAPAGPGEPLARGLPAHAHLAGGVRDAHAAGDPAAQQLAAPRREPCVRMLGHGRPPLP